ncbi:MAG: response regulator [Kiritimatiellia bacterium]|jgi:DNA-binding response OmpR family regulator|nr:response regulator [Kiritimatiellia bacterium]MDP6847931.1 response regulator [Kiritimatiellia bacterium]
MILVVDDDKRTVRTLRIWLEGEGFKVATAENGLKAYGQAKDPECQCILLDITMPRINGVELLLLLQEERVQVPVIIMTGLEDVTESEMKEFKNVTCLLHKPFSIGDMLSAIDMYKAA